MGATPEHGPCRRRGDRLGLRVALVMSLGLGFLAEPASGGEPAPLDLSGAWYVVVHYRDDGAELPQARRWEDKVWTFEPRGSRLVWAEYSAVLFEDLRGRFETLASGRTIRSSGAWRASARQLEEIAKGLVVNPQWARSKSMRGDPTRGYRSVGRANLASASVVGYSETWEIRGLGGHPVFRRTDEMSSGRSNALSGQTEYLSVARNGDSDELRGKFSRDRIQTGSFVMMRSGPVKFATPKDLSRDEQEKWK